jgi:hypothetical protein
MAVLPCRTDTSLDALAQLVGGIISIVWTPLGSDAALLQRGGAFEQPVLLLDPTATAEDQTRAMLEALAIVTVGPEAAATAQRARHLYAVN